MGGSSRRCPGVASAGVCRRIPSRPCYKRVSRPPGLDSRCFCVGTGTSASGARANADLQRSAGRNAEWSTGKGWELSSEGRISLPLPCSRGGDMRQSMTWVATAAGELRSVVWRPDHDGAFPGVVLVDGALEGPADTTWAALAAVLVGRGAVA